jgi:hypothetical protein
MSEMVRRARSYPSTHELGSAVARLSEWWGGSASVSEGWGVSPHTVPAALPPTLACASLQPFLPTALRGERETRGEPS